MRYDQLWRRRKGDRMIRIPFRAWNMCHGRFWRGARSERRRFGGRTEGRDESEPLWNPTSRSSTTSLGCYNNSLLATGMMSLCVAAPVWSLQWVDCVACQPRFNITSSGGVGWNLRARRRWRKQNPTLFCLIIIYFPWELNKWKAAVTVFQNNITRCQGAAAPLAG